MESAGSFLNAVLKTAVSQEYFHPIHQNKIKNYLLKISLSNTILI